MAAKFKKGMRVKLKLSGAGTISVESAVVLRAGSKGVLLDNGAGNEPSGPFDPITGADISDLAGVIPGWRRWIEP